MGTCEILEIPFHAKDNGYSELSALVPRLLDTSPTELLLMMGSLPGVSSLISWTGSGFCLPPVVAFRSEARAPKSRSRSSPGQAAGPVEISASGTVRPNGGIFHDDARRIRRLLLAASPREVGRGETRLDRVNLDCGPGKLR